MNSLLPLGSVVSARGYNKRLMIYGRMQINLSDGKRYDYLACDYPLGVVDTTHGILFDNEAIEKIYFVGFQDVEELNYRKAIVKYLERNAKNGEGEL